MFNELPINKLSQEEIHERQQRVALTDPSQLIKFLEKKSPVIAFVARDLVNAVKGFPDALTNLQQITNLYLGYRVTQLTGDFEEVVDPLTKEIIKVPQTKSDLLTLQEIDRTIRNLYGQAKELDSNWSLDNPPL